MSITPDTLSILDQYRVAAARITDQQTRVLVAAWVEAWNTVADDVQDALDALTATGTPTRAQVRRSRKLAASLDALGAQLEDLAARTGIVVVGDLPSAMTLAGTTNTALIASQLPALTGAALVVDWDRVNPRPLAAIITRTTHRIHASTLPLSDEAVTAMRRNLIRGLASGDNPRTTARRMLLDTEGRFNGGLTRALTISRTETLDAMRAATALSNEVNADVLGGWTWTATLSTRTCAACWAMHGTDFPLGTPGPEGHPNCRCTAVPRTLSWAELGFVGIEEPPSLFPDAEATFAALTPAQQLDILGPRRHAAWLAGDYPMDAWTVRRDNPDWRASWQVSRAPPVAA